MPRKSGSHRPPKPKQAGKSGRKKSTSRTRAGKAGPSSDGKQRLQRYLASAGFGSRRQCEELIEAGRVELDGTVVTKLGTTVDPSVSKVRVDGVLLKKQKLVYYAVNKPIGVVTTNRDPHGRPRVVDLVPPDERVFPVGRLDRNSEGLILLTNDGELAQKLTHPKFGVRKVYRVTVAGKVDSETMRQMRKGIYIAEGVVRVEGAKLLKSRSRSTEMEIVLREGKNREIRRILARLGHKVQHLRRIAVGPLRLGDVPAGAYRVVSHQEVEKLWRATETPPPDPNAKRRGSKKYAGARKGKTSNRRPMKKTASARRGTSSHSDQGLSFESQTTGAVIGADSSAESTPRKRKSTKRRSSATADRPRGGKKKSAGRSTREGQSKRGGGKKKRATKLGGASRGGGRKRGGVKSGGAKRGAKRGGTTRRKRKD